MWCSIKHLYIIASSAPNAASMATPDPVLSHLKPLAAGPILREDRGAAVPTSCTRPCAHASERLQYFGEEIQICGVSIKD
ncbi:hypothetical protein SETIT_5G260300v2 [Setaria italica]|uniref:Uncharacterized protein n=1 Tax=Setaria italica TaxID=4555 RepID=A0A368R8T4_SETIT|nr:hypothetical protein SETIT_5G260300v2 [Setaria italica]